MTIIQKGGKNEKWMVNGYVRVAVGLLPQLRSEDERRTEMIYVDGYSIEQYPLQNRVVITLPQTVHTVQDTQTMPQNRRVKLTSDELTAILVAVKGMYEWRGEEG